VVIAGISSVRGSRFECTEDRVRIRLRPHEGIVVALDSGSFRLNISVVCRSRAHVAKVLDRFALQANSCQEARGAAAPVRALERWCVFQDDRHEHVSLGAPPFAYRISLAMRTRVLSFTSLGLW